MALRTLISFGFLPEAPPLPGSDLPNSAAADYSDVMPDRPSALDNLIREANRTAARKPDSLDLLARMIHLALKDGADPYLVTGVLVEGAVSALAGYIPAERQPEAVQSLVELLSERLKANGL
jgi:hypothetical protein